MEKGAKPTRLFAYKRVGKPLVLQKTLNDIRRVNNTNTPVQQTPPAESPQYNINLYDYKIPKKHLPTLKSSPRKSRHANNNHNHNHNHEQLHQQTNDDDDANTTTANTTTTDEADTSADLAKQDKLASSSVVDTVIQISSSEQSSDNEMIMEDTLVVSPEPLAVSPSSSSSSNVSPDESSESELVATSVTNGVEQSTIADTSSSSQQSTESDDSDASYRRRLRTRREKRINKRPAIEDQSIILDSDDTLDQVVKPPKRHRLIINDDSDKEDQDVEEINNDADDNDEDSDDDNEFEVEKILAKYRAGSKHYYLVKWKGYSHEHNTWEPYNNLNCPALMREFGRELKRKYNTDIVPRKGTILRSMPPFPNTLLQRELNTERRTKRDDKSSNQARASSSRPSTSSVITSSAYKRLLAKEQREANQSRTSGLIKACEPYHYRNETHRRNMQEIEVLLASDLGPRLTVVNNVDDEGLPVKFQYINDIWMNDKDMEQFGFGVMIGCKCKGRCSTAEDSKCGCLRSSDGKFGYNSNGRLRIDQGSAIYECSSKCGCSIQCTNRVVQRGRTVELQLFKTKDRGWGIRTMEDLPAGTYIERYLGEVITNEEAERRGRVYDDAGRTYLFDLDWHGDDTCQYVIDAYPCGNFTRFFNHSCNPNLMVIPVFINTWEATLHQLAFFTRRAIRKFEELTFDYMGGIPIDSDDEGDDDDDDSESSEEEAQGEGPLSRDNNAESVSAGKKPRASKYPCLCGSRHCRKFVHF